jgi:hypothetical protein
MYFETVLGDLKSKHQEFAMDDRAIGHEAAYASRRY